MRRFTKGSVAFSGWITVAVTVSALTGCAPSTPLDTVGDDENVAAVQAECPTDLITDTEWGLGPSESHDLSVIEDALGVSLPTGVGCVLTVGGDTQDSTAYYVFWPNEGASLAESIGQAMLDIDSGYQTGGGDLSFSTSGATAQVYAYAAGEGAWSEYFDESEVVLFFGQFDGQPGKVTSAAPDAGTGQTLTWESSCMLTVDELSSAMATKNIVFGEPQANTTSLETAQCDYRQVNAGNGISAAISINVHPYNPSATYGFAADGQSWTAPSAAEGASNVCALASAVKTVGGLTGICSQVGAAQYVIGANRLNALIFPAGDYFYSVRVMNIYESDSLTAPLTQISSLLADRKPVGR